MKSISVCKNTYPPSNEGSSLNFDVSFLNDTGLTVTPDTVDYRLDCEANRVEVLPWTVFPTPAASIVINIDKQYNAIIDDANVVETRTLTIRATYAAGAEDITDYLRYDLVNMHGI